MTVEQFIEALEAADIGYESSGYIHAAYGEIQIDGTYNVEKLLAAITTPIVVAEREATRKMLWAEHYERAPQIEEFAVKYAALIEAAEHALDPENRTIASVNGEPYTPTHLRPLRDALAAVRAS